MQALVTTPDLLVALDPTHEYHLRTYARAESAGDTDASHISVAVTAVPEPAPMFLLDVSLIGLASGSKLKKRREWGHPLKGLATYKIPLFQGHHTNTI